MYPNLLTLGDGEEVREVERERERDAERLADRDLARGRIGRLDWARRVGRSV